MTFIDHSSSTNNCILLVRNEISGAHFCYQVCEDTSSQLTFHLKNSGTPLDFSKSVVKPRYNQLSLQRELHYSVSTMTIRKRIKSKNIPRG